MSFQKKIRIGTRESELATWQAKHVRHLLLQHHIESELVFIKTEGDINLTQPLYELGVQGIFTKSLDAALLEDRIDIAVHSMKDVPVVLAKGLTQAAVLERASYKDVLVWHNGFSLPSGNADDFINIFGAHLIATSSVRRKAQWLNRFPQATVQNIRGNINTRLRKLEESEWLGAIFAAAGLERIGLRPSSAIDLDWMLPAPAQGAIMILCKDSELKLKEQISAINHADTALCTSIERQVLHQLKGGCSTPISVLVTKTKEQKLSGRASVLSLDGKNKVEVEKQIELHYAKDFAQTLVTELMNNGAAGIVDQFREGGDD